MLLQEAPGNDLITLITPTPPEFFPQCCPHCKLRTWHAVCQLQDASAMPAVSLRRSLRPWTQKLFCAPASRSTPGQRHLFFLWVL